MVLAIQKHMTFPLILILILAAFYLHVRTPQKKITLPTAINVKAWEDSIFGQKSK